MCSEVFEGQNKDIGSNIYKSFKSNFLLPQILIQNLRAGPYLKIYFMW